MNQINAVKQIDYKLAWSYQSTFFYILFFLAIV